MNDWKFRIFKPSEFAVPARPVQRVFLHITASDLEHLKGVKLAEEVNRWHVEKEGWAGVGYHFLIDKEGMISTGRALELTPAAQKGERLGRTDGNIGTIAICTHARWVFSVPGLIATRELCLAIDAAYRAAGRPVTFHGHREIDYRPCPVYGYQGLLGLDGKGNLGAAMYLPVEVVAQAARNLDMPANPLPPEPRLLKLGDVGDDVAKLQVALAVTPDGNFDDWTDKQVRAMQAGHHLVVDGVVGPNTRAVLGL